MKDLKIPYITLPVSVMKTLLEAGFSVELAIAGLLYNVMDDNPYTMETIENKAEEMGERLTRMASLFAVEVKKIFQ